MELRLEVDHDLNLLAALIEAVAHGGILGCGVLGEGHILATGLFHILGTANELLDVEACAGNGQQAHGSKY